MVFYYFFLLILRLKMQLLINENVFKKARNMYYFCLKHICLNKSNRDGMSEGWVIWVTH